MPKIELRNVTKVFDDDFTAVRDVSLVVKDREYATLLGPSGCGKTTLLRTIAGLVKPTSGDILIDGKSVVGVPPEDRNIGYLFQNYALFPHMNVRENVGYGPIVRGESKARTVRITDEMLRFVNLLEWARFMPSELSGGMQQRVALVRSLAAGCCKILFLDEPMSSLDPKIGVKLRYEIQKTARNLGLTVLHVTHDQEDAMSISDKVIVMRMGSVVQVGGPREIYNNPASPYVAHFIGESNFIKTVPVGDSSVAFDGSVITLGENVGGDNIVISIRPERILFEKRLENTLEGVVEDKNFLGPTTRFIVKIGSVKVSVSTAKHPEIKVGDKVYVYLPPSVLRVFRGVSDLDGELRILG
ncbi:MAG: ABC transporter ATP-binding protein [Candidatus Altiarchaeota archaeon]|nr:ABC transporter ATP-binding protein [Candidatus Altiarchaeota archaeon]